MTVVGTRPEIIRLSRVIAKLDAALRPRRSSTPARTTTTSSTRSSSTTSASASPDHFLEAAGGTAAETIGKVIIAVDEVLGEVQPEARADPRRHQLLPGRDPGQAPAIPIFHMEAGNRCFDQRVPEEINRRIVDHIADVNLHLQRHRARIPAARGHCRRTGSSRPAARCSRCCSITGAKIEASRGRWRGSGWSAAATSWSARTARRTSTPDANFAQAGRHR